MFVEGLAMGAASAGGVQHIAERFRTKKPRVHLYRSLSYGVGLLVILFVLAGCTGLVSSSGGGGGTQPVSLQLNPTAVSFGNVGLGKQITQNISISNPGKSTVTITQVRNDHSAWYMSWAIILASAENAT